MKVVLCHQTTGRYYAAAGQWVRRADNALAFEDAAAAHEYLRAHRLTRAKPVYRLAPYLMPLLREHQRQHARARWAAWPAARAARWYWSHARKFERN